jgi:hypothetical protein
VGQRIHEVTLYGKSTEVRLRTHSSPLAVQAPAGVPVVYVLVEDGEGEANATYRFDVVGTGEPVPEGEWTHHLESVVTTQGTVHVFETVTFDHVRAREEYLSGEDLTGE